MIVNNINTASCTVSFNVDEKNNSVDCEVLAFRIPVLFSQIVYIILHTTIMCIIVCILNV